MNRMIGLASVLSDSAGDITFRWTAKTRIDDSTRRVSRSKTLDGGVVLTDSGFTAEDKEMTVYTDYTDTKKTVMKNLHENKTIIHISANGDFFKGTIKEMKIQEENIILNLWLSEKLT